MTLIAMVSYQSQDRASALLLRDELALRGMSVIFDQTSFRWGHRVEADMEHGVGTCDAFVALLTPHYLYLDRPEGAARPALDQEFIPAMRRWREASARAGSEASPHPSVRPIVVPVIRGLGDPYEDAVNAIRRATGENCGGLWRPRVDQDEDVLPQGDAARVAKGVLEALLPRDTGPADGSIELVVATRGTGQPTGDLSIDATPLFGGPTSRAGAPEDWQRYLAGLCDLQEVLSAHGRVRNLRIRANTHLSGAIALGRVFNQETGWRLTIVGRHGEVTVGDATSAPGLQVIWETEDLESKWLLVELEIIDQPVRALGNELLRRVPNAPRGRLQLVNTSQGDLSPETVSRMASAAATSVRCVVRENRPKHVHFTCAAPVEFAVLLGHRLTSLYSDFHLYERDDAQYVASLLLPGNLP